MDTIEVFQVNCVLDTVYVAIYSAIHTFSCSMCYEVVGLIQWHLMVLYKVGFCLAKMNAIGHFQCFTNPCETLLCEEGVPHPPRRKRRRECIFFILQTDHRHQATFSVQYLNVREEAPSLTSTKGK